MSEHPGVPGSEHVELIGLKYQSARARAGLHEAVSSMSAAAASRPTLPQLAQRGAARAGQRALHRTLDAMPAAARDARDAVVRPFGTGTRTRAALAPLVLAAVFAVAAAVVVARLKHNH